jgi:cell surface protein SprA
MCDVNFAADPAANFGGIMRSLTLLILGRNVDYIQFWVMDPYIGKGAITQNNSEELYFNLRISEDVLKDGKKQ